MPQKPTIIDDTSPQIVYSGQWSLGGVEQEYNHTTHGSWTGGSQVKISFSGTSIEVYGTVGREHNNGDPAYSPVTTYVVDGKNDSASTFIGAPGTAIMFNQLLYQSPKLDNGEHQLIVTLTNSNMNAAWIDYLQVEQPASVAPGLIAGIVIGGIVGLLLLVIIGVLLRRISRLSRRQVQYEKVPRKATQTYWPWMSRPPGDVTPFSNDPLSESQPLAARPFLLNSSNYPPQPRESLQHSALDLGTSISGYTTRGGSFADKPSPTASSSRYSHTSGHTSRSGYTTQGGTFADKMPSPTTTTSTTTISTNRTSNSSYNGYNVQGSTLADKVNCHSQPTSTNPARLNNSEHLSPTSDTLELVPRPFLTNRVTVRGEEAPPAY